jgi:hypothetical protein
LGPIPGFWGRFRGDCDQSRLWTTRAQPARRKRFGATGCSGCGSFSARPHCASPTRSPRTVDHLADHVPQATQQRTQRDRPSTQGSRRVRPALSVKPMKEDTMAAAPATGSTPAPGDRAERRERIGGALPVDGEAVGHEPGLVRAGRSDRCGDRSDSSDCSGGPFASGVVPFASPACGRLLRSVRSPPADAFRCCPVVPLSHYPGVASCPESRRSGPWP